jgi:hypothetical protein
LKKVEKQFFPANCDKIIKDADDFMKAGKTVEAIPLFKQAFSLASLARDTGPQAAIILNSLALAQKRIGQTALAYSNLKKSYAANEER